MDYSVIRTTLHKHLRARLERAKAWRERHGPLAAKDRANIKDILSMLEEGNREYWHLLGSDHAREELDKFFKETGLPRDECRDHTSVILDEIRKGQIGYWKALLAHSEALEVYDFSEAQRSPQSASAPRPAPLASPTLSEAVEAFFREHEKTAGWTSGTVEKRRAVLDVALEWLGPDTAMADIGKREAAGLKEATLALPANRAKVSRLRGLSLREAIAVPGIPKISNATANAYLSAYKVFWAWAEAHGFAPEALFDGMAVAKRGHGTKDRRPFTQEALEKVYSALTDPGSKFFGKTSHRWATLIAMFSGARLNEVCQLQVDDILQVDGVWVFNFTDDGDATKRLKSSAARRRVPVHSELLKLGLLEYRDSQRALGRDRLFADYTYHPKHGYGDKLSKWFNRTFMQALGIKSDAHVFHGLRHTFATRLGQADVPLERIQFIIGHERQGVTNQVYMKEGFTLRQTREAVERYAVD
ncbi:site-specific integrase [Thioclava electrotropha]|nr:site-specific integrase [Thioclava electrotropha]